MRQEILRSACDQLNSFHYLLRMARLPLLFLALAVLPVANIPVVKSGDKKVVVCESYVKVGELVTGDCQYCFLTVTNVLKVTGLSYFDFLLLQNGKISVYSNDTEISTIYPPFYLHTTLDKDASICVSGYLTSS